MWIDVQRHLRSYILQFTTEVFTSAEGVTTERRLQLRVPHYRHVLQHKTVAKQLKQHMKMLALGEWKAATDQGRTVRCQRGLSDAEFRFAIRARLNLMCTRTVLKRMRQLRNAVCRTPGCTHQETLPHVINHCRGNEDTIRGRHDNIFELIKKEVSPIVEGSRGRLRVQYDEPVTGYADPQFRPDIQLFDHASNKAYVTDLSISFDEQFSDDPMSSNHTHAYEHKIRKYAPLKHYLESQGWEVHLSAIVFGSLGGVGTRNYKIFTEHLGHHKRTANQLNRRVSATAIQSSHRIWRLHAPAAASEAPTTASSAHADPTRVPGVRGQAHVTEDIEAPRSQDRHQQAPRSSNSQRDRDTQGANAPKPSRPPTRRHRNGRIERPPQRRTSQHREEARNSPRRTNDGAQAKLHQKRGASRTTSSPVSRSRRNHGINDRQHQDPSPATRPPTRGGTSRRSQQRNGVRLTSS